MTDTQPDSIRQQDRDGKEGRRILRAIADRMEAAGYTAEAVGRLSRLSHWQSLTKNIDGEAEIHDLYGFRLAPSWDEGPKWPVVTPGPSVNVTGRVKAKAKDESATRVIAVLPDMQIGYYRDRLGQLVAIHDVEAIEAAIRVVKASKATEIVALGDNLDLPEMSRYRLSPAFQQTTQAAIDYATTLFARLGSMAPTTWLAGNHEERLSNWLLDNAMAAHGLRQGDAPDAWPVMSVPHLCRLDEAGVTYRPGYPASDLWITDTLRIIHGDRVKSRGSTAHVYLAQEKVSVIYGHIHRIEQAHQRREDHNGAAEIMAASPGCLARTDGVVPSTKQGIDLDGRPLVRPEDWHQGCAVVTVFEDDSWAYEQARISDGVAHFRGKRFAA